MKYAGWLPGLMAGGLLSVVLFGFCMVFLTAGAGRTNEDEKVHLNFFDRWFTEIAALLVVGIWLAGVTLVLDIFTWSLEVDEIGYLIVFLILGLWTGIWFFTGWTSLAKRIKAASIWKKQLCEMGSSLLS